MLCRVHTKQKFIAYDLSARSTRRRNLKSSRNRMSFIIVILRPCSCNAVTLLSVLLNALISRDDKLVCRCWCLLSRLWMSFAVGRYAYSFADDKETVDDDLNVYFAPDKLLPGGNPLLVVLATWRKSLYLRPRRTGDRSIPICYWLILLGGDVETNPGPVKFPCTICGKPVKSNQMGVCCDECEN